MQKLPQLTLRDLFWLVALVAMGCGWWVDRSSVAQRVLDGRDEVEQRRIREAAMEYGLKTLSEEDRHAVKQRELQYLQRHYQKP